MADIVIPESSLRDIVATQLAARFDDPEIIHAFVSSLLENRVDPYGRISNRPSDPTILRWAIEGVIRKFVEETAKSWLLEHHDEFVSQIGEELTKSDLIRKLAKETAEKITVR